MKYFIVLCWICTNNCLCQKNVDKIKGDWIYSYSFKSDTIIMFTEISQSMDPYLSAEYIFKNDTTSKSDYLLKKFETNLLSEIVCIIPGNLFRFYPVAYGFSNRLMIRKMEVQLYYESGLKYKNFRILKIKKNRIYIKDSRRHLNDGQIYTDFTHVYIRKL